MTGGTPFRVVAYAALRSVGTIAVLAALYYLLPFDHTATWASVAFLVIGLVVLFALVVFQVRRILVSPFPGLRAVEALATTVPFALFLFAGTYYVVERLTPGSFTQSLSRTDALYFTVTVFSTVGFGDITARTQQARLLVTGQMIIDLLVVGVVLKVILGAARTGAQRRSRGFT
jgi:hypothetical protein